MGSSSGRKGSRKRWRQGGRQASSSDPTSEGLRSLFSETRFLYVSSLVLELFPAYSGLVSTTAYLIIRQFRSVGGRGTFSFQLLLRLLPVIFISGTTCSAQQLLTSACSC